MIEQPPVYDSMDDVPVIEQYEMWSVDEEGKYRRESVWAQSDREQSQYTVDRMNDATANMNPRRAYILVTVRTTRHWE